MVDAATPSCAASSAARPRRLLETRSTSAPSATCCAHYPRRLDDRGELTDFADLRSASTSRCWPRPSASRRNSTARKGGGREATRTEVIVTDGDARPAAARSSASPGEQDQLQAGTVALFSGKVGGLPQPPAARPSRPVDILGRGCDLDEFEDEDGAALVADLSRDRQAHVASRSWTRSRSSSTRSGESPTRCPTTSARATGFMPYDEALIQDPPAAPTPRGVARGQAAAPVRRGVRPADGAGPAPPASCCSLPAVPRPADAGRAARPVRRSSCRSS